jgi:TolA-binding protein
MCCLAPNRFTGVDESKEGANSMDDEKRWQDMNADEQAKRITELENRIEALEAKIKATETQETAKGLLTDTGAIG